MRGVADPVAANFTIFGMLIIQAMDKATQTMIDNLHKNTGKTLEQWIAIVRKEKFGKHGEIVKFLKDTHSMTHGFANLVAHKANASDAASAPGGHEELLAKQYKGKEHFRPLYDKLLSVIQGFGNDVEVASKNVYMSMRRKKQFAILQPATKTRFEVGLNLKGQEPAGKLQAIKAANSMCSHKIDLAEESDLSDEVVLWLKKAYDSAG